WSWSLPFLKPVGGQWSQAAGRRRNGLTTSRTCTPRRPSMSINVSMLKRCRRPRRRSLTRGWVTCSSFASCACLSPRAVATFWIWIRRSARITRCSASCAEKPRSRNTLPLDGVTFSLSFAGIGPSPVHERAQAILGELQIVFRRLSRALLEGVEDIHGFGKRGDVEHPVFQARMNPDLPDARTNGGHRFPVVRIETLLDAPALEARVPPRIGGEGAQGGQGAAEPRDGLVRH